MATFTITGPSRNTSISVLHALAAPFVGLWQALVAMGEAHSHMKSIESLQALSDEDLDKIGLRRADIARHVMRSYGWL